MAVELTLQPRLQAIADLVPRGTRLTDVGTDHGYLPVWLLRRGRIASAIASDIVPGPLDHARRTAALYLPEGDIRFRLCDGLKGIGPEETDTVVIAGMGGETIAHILAEAPWTRAGKGLLLQPMSKAEVLRRWLTGAGYTVVREVLVRDKGILYPILAAEGGPARAAAPGQFCYGWAEEDPLFPAYLAQWSEKVRRAAEGLERAENPDADRLEETRALLRALEERQRCLP